MKHCKYCLHIILFSFQRTQDYHQFLCGQREKEIYIYNVRSSNINLSQKRTRLDVLIKLNLTAKKGERFSFIIANPHAVSRTSGIVNILNITSLFYILCVNKEEDLFLNLYHSILATPHFSNSYVVHVRVKLLSSLYCTLNVSAA